MQTVYLDLETTGLHPSRDEIVEIGILDDQGQPLLDTLVRPIRHTSWPEAEYINGISPEDVASAPVLSDLRSQIIEAVTGTRVVIYNAAFDSAFLASELRTAAEIEYAMLAFAEVYGEWNPYYEDWRWQRLYVAAAHVGFEWPGSSHRAIHDCAATRAVWRYIGNRRPRAG
jgi:DNA polymerase-3 subunit epsilon